MANSLTRSCDPSTGQTYRFFSLEQRLPDDSGSVLTEVHFTWDGVSIWPQCDGPVIFLRTRNTGTSPAWAMLPDKKKPPLWVKLDPGTDVTVTQKGTLNNLGLSNALDVVAVTFQFTDPAAV